MNKIEDLIKIYCDTEIPDELEYRVRHSIRGAKMKQYTQNIKKTAIALTAALLIFAGMVNLSPNLAMAMSEVPVIGSIVRVLSYRFDVIENENVNAHIETPVIEGLEDDGLQAELNEKYFEENKVLYEEFTQDMEAIMKSGGHMGVDAGYVVKTDTEALLSIGRYVVNTVGSSSTVFQYDTIDKVNEVLITLPSLFKDDQYIERISEYLIKTMDAAMKADADKVYWIKEEDMEPFKLMDANQSFYITDKNKLVISFDKYAVAPGCMGMVEFEVPTEVIGDLLVSDLYIR